MKKLIFTFIIYLSFVSACHASIVSVVSNTNIIEVGTKIPVDIFLDTQGSSINSLDMSITYPTELMDFVGYDNKNGTIPFWISLPQEKSSGKIYFSGVIPGGIDRLYDSEQPNNKAVKIIRLFFKMKSTGLGTIVIKDAHLLKNDGLGSTDTFQSQAKSFNIIKPNAVSTNQNEEDILPPLPFTVSIVDSSFFGKTPRLAVFKSEDRESGIKKYEVKIGRDFHITESPYPLPHRLFSYTLSVRAYDFSNNFREQEIVVSGDKQYGLFTVVILGFIFMLLYRYNIKRKKYE